MKTMNISKFSSQFTELISEHVNENLENNCAKKIFIHILFNIECLSSTINTYFILLYTGNISYEFKYILNIENI